MHSGYLSGLVIELTQGNSEEKDKSSMMTIVALSAIAVIINITLRILICVEKKNLSNDSSDPEDVSTFGILLLLSLFIMFLLLSIIFAAGDVIRNVIDVIGMFVMCILLPGMKILMSKSMKKYAKNWILKRCCISIQFCSSSVEPRT